MCGIAGIAPIGGGPPATRDELRRMCDTLVRRGPDAEGVSLHDGVGLAARRLSIIDVASGHQPLSNEDGSVRVVYNGEIYNHAELRDELLSAGHQLRSATDGEVIAHLWEEHGIELLSHLHGMFAFALYDERARRLLLARDRLGIKPLYYAVRDDAIVFGSELRTVLASGRLSRTLDLTALGEFLTWEYIAAPRTLVIEVRKLDAAEALTFDLTSGARERTRWWRLPPADPSARRASAEEWRDEVQETLDRSVQRRLMSDVPIGALLSGGVDSSLVVSAMGATTTYSIGFEDPSYNELPWASTVAAHLGVEHRTEVIRPDAVGLFEQLMPHLSDPIADFSVFPTYLVCQLAAQEVKVVLSGDGGDELFGGYDTYLAQRLASLVFDRAAARPFRGCAAALAQRLRPGAAKKGAANKLRRFLEGLAHDPTLGHGRWRRFLSDDRLTALLLPEARAPSSGQGVAADAHMHRLFAEAAGRGPTDRGLYVDLFSYLTHNCLAKVDRMSMAASLEVRVPFLDHDLVELAFRVPAEHKLRAWQTKPLLKAAAARRVPPRSVYRRKEGFSIPMRSWLRAEFGPLMDELLRPSRLVGAGIFDPDSVARLVSQHRAGRADHSHTLWALMVFEDWRERWAV